MVDWKKERKKEGQMAQAHCSRQVPSTLVVDNIREKGNWRFSQFVPFAIFVYSMWNSRAFLILCAWRWAPQDWQLGTLTGRADQLCPQGSGSTGSIVHMITHFTQLDRPNMKQPDNITIHMSNGSTSLRTTNQELIRSAKGASLFDRWSTWLRWKLREPTCLRITECNMLGQPCQTGDPSTQRKLWGFDIYMLCNVIYVYIYSIYIVIHVCIHTSLPPFGTQVSDVCRYM